MPQNNQRPPANADVDTAKRSPEQHAEAVRKDAEEAKRLREQLPFDDDNYEG
jgi:hypothetical protein